MNVKKDWKKPKLFIFKIRITAANPDGLSEDFHTQGTDNS